MFIPASFRVDDLETLYRFVESHGFATLVTMVEGVPFASHIPLLLDRVAGVLLGHLARANPQWEHFGTGGETLAIFHGPHAYISPSWYVTAPAVPTWNYAVVHIYGTPRLVSAEHTSRIVDQTVSKYEGTRAQPWPNVLPEEFRQRLLAGIVGFEMPIARLEGKFKIGQNRPAVDQVSMRAALRHQGIEANLLAEWIDDVRSRESGDLEKSTPTS